jgi:hypothetical protein
MHVAMVSTFMGLFVRIAALEGARVNDALWSKADRILSHESPAAKTSIEA